MANPLAALPPPEPLVGFAVAAAFLALLLLLSREATRRVLRARPVLRLTLGAAGVSGLALGALALVLGPVAARLGPADLLLPGRWWDVDAQALLTERLLALGDGLGTALTLPLGAMPPVAAVLAWLAVLSAAVVATALAATIRWKPGGVATVAGAAAIALGVAAALLLPAAVMLGLWIVGQLNFWLFAVLGIAFQFHRHGRL